MNGILAQWEPGPFVHVGAEFAGEGEDDLAEDGGPPGAYWTTGLQLGPTYWARVYLTATDSSGVSTTR